jgi:hypothetical protein
MKWLKKKLSNLTRVFVFDALRKNGIT